MISTWSGLIHKTPFESYYPPAMTDTSTLQQLQNCIAEMEQCCKEELRKLKADHDQLEAYIRRPQGKEHSAHTLPEGTQRELHPRRSSDLRHKYSSATPKLHCGDGAML